MERKPKRWTKKDRQMGRKTFREMDRKTEGLTVKQRQTEDRENTR